MVMVESRAEPRRVVLEEETLQQRILSLGASWQTAQYALIKHVAELDAVGGWVGQGFSCCAQWVAWALDIEVSTAREWVRVGRALDELPQIDAAFDAGLSYTKVRTLTRVASRRNERDLLELSWTTPAGRLGGVLARWLMDREDPEVTVARQQEARSLSWKTEPDGLIHGAFRLPPVVGARLTNAVDAIVRRRLPDRSRDASADASRKRWPSLAQQRADALVELLTGGGADFVTEIVVNVRGDGASYDDGTPIPWSELERIAPESFVRALIHDAAGRPVNASARQRHPTVRQRRVVMAQHRGCVDCGSTELLEYDHDPPYDESGHTVVAELVPRCGPCHRKRTVERNAARTRDRS